MEIYYPVLRVFADGFSWSPFRCGIVALFFTVFMFSPHYKNGAKLIIGIAALVWWFLTYTEATTPVTSSIRIDLLFSLPAAILFGLLGLAMLFIGRKWKGSNKPSVREPATNGRSF
jgi:uncharacterized membrane protein